MTIAERSLDPALKTSLLNNDPFIIYHLVKFEKPQPSLADGAVANKPQNYAYITDAPFNKDWDDGSYDSVGNANGVQTYVANKLISVGGVQETIEARASSMTLKLSTTALGSYIVTIPTITATYIEIGQSFIDLGFREGDKLYLTSNGPNGGKYVRIDSFTPANSSAGILTKDSSL